MQQSYQGDTNIKTIVINHIMICSTQETCIKKSECFSICRKSCRDVLQSYSVYHQQISEISAVNPSCCDVTRILFASSFAHVHGIVSFPDWTFRNHTHIVTSFNHSVYNHQCFINLYFFNIHEIIYFCVVLVFNISGAYGSMHFVTKKIRM